MLRYLLLLPLFVLLAAPANAQKRGGGLQEFKTDKPDDETGESTSSKESRRRAAAGLQDLKSFGAAREPPPTPFPWMAVGLAVLILGALSPFAWKMYRSTRKDLEDQSTFGMGKGARLKEGESAEAPRIGRRPPARQLKAAAPEKEVKSETRVIDTSEVTSNRDIVWDAVSGAGDQWVTTDWVASKSGITANQATDELGSLVEEGYLQQARDRNGKAVFKPA